MDQAPRLAAPHAEVLVRFPSTTTTTLPAPAPHTAALIMPIDARTLRTIESVAPHAPEEMPNPN